MYLETFHLIHSLVLTGFFSTFFAIIKNFAILSSLNSHSGFQFLSLHFLLYILDILATGFYNEGDINLKLSINFSLYIIVLSLPSSFLVGTEKVLYFPAFSPKHSN